MKLGFVGPAGGEGKLLREALEFLLNDAGVDQAIYLGLDGTADRVVEAWAKEMGAEATSGAILERAVELAREGDPAAIDDLLARDDAVERLSCVRTLPPSPARAIEMIEDRIVTVVYDKAVLDEEDIANSTLLVYGKSDEALLKRFGPRYFFTPGPLGAGKIGIVEADKESQIVVGLFAPSGASLWREALQGRMTSKMTVSS